MANDQERGSDDQVNALRLPDGTYLTEKRAAEAGENAVAEAVERMRRVA